MKTKLQIINETVRYYSTHKRGYNEYSGGCEYLTEEGNMCAVGRCLLKKEVSKLSGIGDYEELSDIYDYNVPFKASYKGHESEFWTNLQSLHDVQANWKENLKGGQDLTESGANRLAFLKNRYANN